LVSAVSAFETDISPDFLPFSPIFFENFAAGEAVALADNVHTFLAPRAAPRLPYSRRFASARLPGRPLAALRSLVGINRLEFAISASR